MIGRATYLNDLKFKHLIDLKLKHLHYLKLIHRIVATDRDARGFWSFLKTIYNNMFVFQTTSYIDIQGCVDKKAKVNLLLAFYHQKNQQLMTMDAFHPAIRRFTNEFNLL